MVPERIRKLDQSTDHVVAAVFLTSFALGQLAAEEVRFPA